MNLGDIMLSEMSQSLSNSEKQIIEPWLTGDKRRGKWGVFQLV